MNVVAVSKFYNFQRHRGRTRTNERVFTLSISEMYGWIKYVYTISKRKKDGKTSRAFRTT